MKVSSAHSKNTYGQRFTEKLKTHVLSKHARLLGTLEYQKKPFGTWQFGKIVVLVNFVIQKLKSKDLVCFSFLW
jgi:hypothetical protein